MPEPTPPPQGPGPPAPPAAPPPPPATPPPPPANVPVPPADAPASPADAPARPGLDDRERTLDPAIVRVWRLVNTLATLLPTFAATIPALVILGRVGWLVPLAGTALLGVTAGWYPRARYARWHWRLTGLALELRYGVLVHRHDAVPYFRIQQIDVAQGPLDRLLGLASLQVTTASASGSAVLPGIAAVEAPTVRAELLARAAEAAAELKGDLSDAV